MFPRSDLADLRRRIAATRWPDKETVADQSQGAQLAKLQELVRYWGTDYDWRKVRGEAECLAAIHDDDRRRRHSLHSRPLAPSRTRLPVIVTHGWPGSVIEQLKIIDPLTDPTAHGGSAEDAFDVVIPSLPGYGFSGKPTGTGWDPDRIARAWAELMKRLGYTRYVAQGGDWGSPISSAMARQAAGGLARHPHQLAGDGTARGGRGARAAGRCRPGLSEKERAVFEALMANGKEWELGVLHDDDRAAADGRLRRDGLAGRPRGVDPRASGLRAVDVRRRSRTSRRRKTTCWTTSRCTG